MKRTAFIGCLLLFVLAACNLPSAQNARPTLAPTNTAVADRPVTFGIVSLILPTGLASDAAGQVLPAVVSSQSPLWEIAPEHTELTLAGYPLQGKLLQPKVYVFPAGDYATLNAGAAESQARVRSLLAGTSLSRENLPIVPGFNATPILAAQAKALDFQNGRGIRLVTQYDQYPAPVNNHELIYQFQGLTADDRYYVIAVLPVSALILADTERPDAPVPAGGVPLPSGAGPDEGYYTAITNKLNALAPETFSPSLLTLDKLIQSLQITGP